MMPATALALALLLLGLLSVPVDLIFSAQRRESFRGGLSARWLFGLVRAPVPLRRARRKRRERPKESRGAQLRRARYLLATLRDPDFRRRLLKFLGRVRRALRIRDLELRLRLGMDDPADTGRLWAAAGPLFALPPLAEKHVDIHLDFTEACFEFDAAGTIRIIPAQLALVVLLWLLSPPVLRSARTYWRLGRK